MQLEDFLISNQLWASAGSIADQAGMSCGALTDARREVERFLIELGEEQVRLGKINMRTASCV